MGKTQRKFILKLLANKTTCMFQTVSMDELFISLSILKLNNFPMYLFGIALYGKRRLLVQRSTMCGRKFQCTEIPRKTGFSCTITSALRGSGLVGHKLHTNHSALFIEHYVAQSSSTMPCFH